MRKASWLSLIFVFAACSSELPHESPYDPQAPLDRQAKASLSGIVQLEGETDFSQVTLELQNVDRTYNVDTAADGAVSLTGIVPGEYTLKIRTRYFEPVQDILSVEMAETLDLGTRTLVPLKARVLGQATSERIQGTTLVTTGGVSMTLKKTASIRAAVAKAPGLRPAAAETTSAKLRTVSGVDGDFEFGEVPAGGYTLYAATSETGERAVGTVTVTGEGDVTVDPIVLRPLTGYFEILGSANGVPSSTYTSIAAVNLQLQQSNAVQVKVSVSTNGSTTGCDLANAAPEALPSNTLRPLTFTSEGKKLVCVSYVDADGKETAPIFGSITYDATPPTLPSVAINGGAQVVSSNLVTLSISAVDALSGVAVHKVHAVNDFSAVSPKPFQPTDVYSLATGDGLKTVWVVFGDHAGNYSAPVSAMVLLDSAGPVTGGTAPSVTKLDGTPLTSPAVIAESRVKLTSSLTDLSSLEMQIATDGVTLGKPWVPYEAGKIIDLPSGTSTLVVRVRDAAGNVVELLSGFTITTDTTPPTGTLTIAAAAVTDPAITVQASGSMDAVEVELAFDPGFVTSLGRFTPGPIPITLPLGDGTKTVYGRFFDAAGNTSALVGDTVTLDTTPPQILSFTIAQASPTKDNPVTVNYSASGAAELRITEGAECGGARESVGAGTKTFTVSSPEGSKEIRLQFFDAAGNASECAVRTVYYDPNPPVIGTLQINYGQAATNSNIVTLTFPGVSGATKVMVSEDAGFSGADWQSFSASKTFTLSPGNGVKTVYAKVADDAGHVVNLTEQSITLDTTPPSSPSIFAAVDVTSQTSVQLSLAAGLVSEMWITQDDPTFTTGAWETYSGTKLFALTGTDGTKTIYAKFKKSTGVETSVVSDTVVLDRTAPILPSLQINGGTAVVTSNIVTLNMSAVDAASGLYTYKVNDANDFTALSPKPYQTSDVYALAGGDGAKTVWVIYGDRAGHYSAPVSKTVLLDTTPPSAGSVAVTKLDATPVAAGGTVTDNRILLTSSVSDLTPLEMQVTTNGSYAGLGWEPYNPSKVIDLTSPSSAISARVRDAAGQVTTLLTGFIVNLDNTAPTLTLTRTSASPTNDLQVLLALAASETSDAQVSEDPGFSGAAWFPTASTSLTLAPGDGLRTIYARARDAAGNVGALKTVQVAVDQTPPQGADFSIVSGGLTKSRAVSLAFAAIGAAEVRAQEGAGCGGAYAAFGSTGSVTLTSPGDGVKNISVQYRDTVGNETACLTKPVTLDETPPEAGFVLLDGGAAYTTQRVVGVGVSVTGATQMQVAENAAFTGAAWQPVTTNAAFTLSPGEGAKAVYVRFRDDAGNETGPVSDAIVVDTLAPAFNSLTAPAAVPATAVTLTLAAADADEMRLSADPAFVGAPWSPFSAFAPFALANVQGAHTVFVQLRDAAGNLSVVRSVTVTLDSQAPATPLVTALGGGYTQTAAISLQILADGASEMLVSQFAAMTDATWAPFAQLKSFTLAGGDGAKSVYVKVRDAAGNESGQAAAAVVQDATPPVVTLFQAQDGAGSPVAATNQLRYYLRLDASDANPLTVQYSSTGIFTGAPVESYAPVRAWDVAPPADPAGENRAAHVRIVDAAGNATTPFPVTVLVDTLGPTAPSLALAASLVSDATVGVTLSAVGASYVELSGDISFLAPVSFAYTAATTYTFAAGDGPKTLYARYVDAAGNFSAVVAASTVLDQTAPEAAGFSIVQASPTNQSLLTLNLTAVGAAQAAIAEGACGADWTSFAAVKTFALANTAAVGPRTIAVRYRDAAGNATDCLTRTIIYDAEAPAVVSFAVNYGAPATSSGTVTLSFDVAGATQAQVSEQSTFADAAWVPYSAERTFVLSAGNGTKTVYARFRDDAGNTTARVDDSIVLDTTSVGVPYVSIQADATSATEVTVQFAAANADEIMISDDPGFAAAAWAPYFTVTQYTFAGADGVKTLYAKFRKLTGEETAVVSDTYTLDRAAPSFSQVRIDNGAAYTTSGQVTLLLTGVDDLSGVAAMQLDETPALAGAAERAYAPALVFPLSAGAGTKTVWARFGDRAGNYAAPVSASIVYDTDTPVVGSFQVEDAAGNPLTLFNSARVVVHLEAADANPLEMMVSNRSDFAGSVWQPYQNFLQWDLPLPALPGGEPRTVYAKVRDAAGRIESAGSYPLVLDTQAPTGPAVDILSAYTTQVTVSVALAYAGADWIELSADVGFQSALRFAARATTTYTFAPGDGAKVLYARFGDDAGNVSAVVADQVVLDTQPPQLAAFSILQGDLTNLATVNLALSAVDAADMRIGEGGCVAGWTPFATSAPYTFADNSEVLKTIAVQFRDAVGNATGCLSRSVFYDKTAPTPLAVTVATGAAKVRHTVVPLEIYASDNLAVVDIQVSNSSTFQGAAWEPVTTSTTWLLAPVEGAQTVYVRFRDGAGNVSGAISDGIEVDQTPPQSVTLGFDDGAVTNLGARRMAWEPVPGAAGYRVSECEGAAECVQVLATTDVGAATSWQSVLLENDYSRSFYVSAVYAGGATSAPSAPALRGWGGLPAVRSGILLVDDDGGTAQNDRLLADLAALGYAVTPYVVAAGANGPPLATMQNYAVVFWASDDRANPLTPADEANLAALTGDRTLILWTPGYATQASSHPARAQRLLSGATGYKLLGGSSTVAVFPGHPVGAGVSFRPLYPVGATGVATMTAPVAGTLAWLRESSAPALAPIALTTDWRPRAERAVAVNLPYTYIANVGQSFGLAFDASWQTAATPTGIVADDAKAVFALPFAFPFYDRYFSQVTISANGFLAFLPFAGGGVTPPGETIAVAEPNAFVAGYWHDLNPAAAGSIKYASSPAAFTVSWDGVRDYSTTVTQSFQITLYPDGRIRTYLHAVSDSSQLTTLGIENATGTLGMLFDMAGAGPMGGLGVDFTSEGPNPHRLTLLRELLRFALPPNRARIEPVPYASVSLGADGAVEMMVSTDGTFDTEGWQAYAASFTVPVAGEGGQTVFVKLRDEAGNETVVATATVTVDVTPPENASLAVGNGAYTGSQIVTLQTPAAGATQMMLSESPVFTGAAAQPWAPTATFVLGAGEGAHTIYARYIDAAGNSVVRSASTTLDLTPPEAPIIETPSYVTTASLVTVTLANDNPRANEAIAFGSYEVQGGNYPAWTPVVPALVGGKPTFTFSLAADGEYRLSIRARDMAGNLSAADTLTLTRDTQAPDAPADLRIEEGNGSFNLTWSASASSDLVGYRVYYGAAAGTWTGNFATEGPSPIELGKVLTAKLNGLPNNVRVYVGVAAVDRVGLESAKLTGDALPNAVTPAEKLNWVNAASVKVSVDGSLAAYIKTNGYEIWDLSNPYLPVTIATYTNAGWTLVDGQLDWPHLYLLDTAGPSLKMIRVNTPSAPVYSANYALAGAPYALSVTQGRVAMTFDAGGIRLYNRSLTGNLTLAGTTGFGGGRIQCQPLRCYTADTLLSVFDTQSLTTPSMTRLGWVNAGIVADFKVYANKAYVALRADNYGLAVYDVSNPASMPLLGTALGETDARSLAIEGSYAYLGNEDYGDFKTVKILDLADLTRIKQVGLFRWEDTFDGVKSVAVSKTNLFMATKNGGKILSIAEPQLFKELDSYVLPGSWGGPSYRMVIEGTVLMTNAKGIELMDVRDPANLQLIADDPTLWAREMRHGTVYSMQSGQLSTHYLTPAGTLATKGPFAVVGGQWDYMHVRGPYGFMADGDTGLRVLNVINGGAPAAVSTCAPSGGVCNAAAADAGGNVVMHGRWAFLMNQYDMPAKLTAINVAAPATPVPVAEITAAGQPAALCSEGKRLAFAAEDMHLLTWEEGTSTFVEHAVIDRWASRDCVISGDYLYLPGGGGLEVYNIANLAAPKLVATYYQGWTALPTGNLLFLGDTEGGLISGRIEP